MIALNKPTMNPLIVKKDKVIDATPLEIWNIITRSEYFDEWMYVPGQLRDEQTLRLGSKIEWINDNNITYLTGEVITFIPEHKLVISLQDISWKTIYPKGTVTYEFHLEKVESGTKLTFLLGDLSADPEGELWFETYNSSDEIGSIEQLIKRLRGKDKLHTKHC